VTTPSTGRLSIAVRPTLPTGSTIRAWTTLTLRILGLGHAAILPETADGAGRRPTYFTTVLTRCPKTIMRCEEFQVGLQVVSVSRAWVGVAGGLPGTGSSTQTSFGSTIVAFGSLSTWYV
jgi:hypothetical protein